MKFFKFNFLIAQVFFLCVLLVGGSAWSQEEDESSESKRNIINFEDQLVEGKTKKPELVILLQQKQFNYERLIRLRNNFLPELRKTAQEIQRKGSGD
jgi:hypothetical protein